MTWETISLMHLNEPDKADIVKNFAAHISITAPEAQTLGYPWQRQKSSLLQKLGGPSV